MACKRRAQPVLLWFFLTALLVLSCPFPSWLFARVPKAPHPGRSTSGQKDFGKLLVGFGKNRGLTFAEVYDRKYPYIEWLRHQANPSPQACALMGYADMRDEEEPCDQQVGRRPCQTQVGDAKTLGATPVGFGKHSDLTFAELYNQEYQYLQWLRDQELRAPKAAALLEYADMRDSTHNSQCAQRHKRPSLGERVLRFSNRRRWTFASVYKKDYRFIEYLRGVSEYDDLIPEFESLLDYADMMDAKRPAETPAKKAAQKALATV